VEWVVKIRSLVLGAVAALGVAMSGAAHAATYIMTGIGKADITVSGNSLTVVLTNLISNPTSAGQLFSGIDIYLTGAPTTAVLTSQAGQLANIDANGQPVLISGSPNHWGLTKTGSHLDLATVGILGGKPDDLIMTANPPFGNANSSITQHLPVILGPGTFQIALTGALNPVIDHVTFNFGTSGGEHTYVGSLCTTACVTTQTFVPEPASWALMLTGFGGMGALLRMRRRRAFATPA
jgi:hypothetical protein